MLVRMNETTAQMTRKPRDHSDLPGRAATIVRRKARRRPRLGVILGSGFQGVLTAMRATAAIPYSDLPGFPKPSVQGHEGRVLCGQLGGTETVVLAGRVHYYEGRSMEDVTFGVRVLAQLGVESVLITNAAGGINPRFHVGDFMMLTDHINFMGVNPLRGVNAGGATRFADMTQAYDPELQTLLRRAGRSAKVPVRQGVYLAVCGPCYETPVEIRAFRRLGADAVGMSTVPEVIAARQHGVRVAAVSCITNLAAGLGDEPLAHGDVLATGARVSERAARLLEHFANLYGNC